MDADVTTDTGAAGGEFESIHRLEFEVPWPPKHVAAYLLDGDEPILIDAGPPGDDAQAALADQLSALGYEPADVAHVLLTHPHSDHVGQVPVLREAGAEIHATRGELDQLRRDEASLEAAAREVGRGIGFEGEALDREVDRACESLRRNRRLVDPDATRPFDGTAPFRVGGREFAPIHTPGHQIHHTCFETTVAGRRILFAGDALIESFRPALIQVGLDHGAAQAADAYSVALNRLGTSRAERAFPGHGPIFDDVAGVVEASRADLDALVEETRSGVSSVGPATAVEIAEDRVGEIRYPVQLLDTVGALGRLERRGDVAVAVDDGVRYYAPP